VLISSDDFSIFIIAVDMAVESSIAAEDVVDFVEVFERADAELPFFAREVDCFGGGEECVELYLDCMFLS